METITWQSVLVPDNPEHFWLLIAGLGAIGTALATGALVFVAYKGLKSIKLAQAAIGVAQQELLTAQKDIVVKAKRDGLGCAVRCAQELADTIIPAHTKIHLGLKAAGIKDFTDSSESVLFTDLKRLAEARVWIASVPPELRADSIRLLNHLEHWAMHFTTGLAARDEAYGSCAHAYCAIVMKLYPFLLDYRERTSTGHFPNTVALFELWRNVTATAHLKIRAADIAKQLEELGGSKNSLPGTVGTELE